MCQLGWLVARRTKPDVGQVSWLRIILSMGELSYIIMYTLPRACRNCMQRRDHVCIRACSFSLLPLPLPLLPPPAMAVTQTQSPWTYTSPMELPLARGLNSSGSESSIDSGFESPLSGKGSGSDSPVNRAPSACLNDAITTSGLNTMLVRRASLLSTHPYTLYPLRLAAIISHMHGLWYCSRFIARNISTRCIVCSAYSTNSY